MRILLFGKNGQVGYELNQLLPSIGEVTALGREEADFTEPESLREIVRMAKPDVIVNAAAYTAVDKAESDAETAMAVNGYAPGVIAEECKQLRALLIHYSTDYIFDGEKKTPYVEDDEPNPISEYGRSKLEGERAIIKSGCDYLILRTSWVYSARGSNFLLSILRLAKEKQELNIVDDQTGSPTWARDIAEITGNIILASEKQRLTSEFTSGVYNLVSSGTTTWFDFAREIVDIATALDVNDGFVVNQILPISSENYQTPAKRPLYSVLSTDKIESHFGFSPMEWKSSLRSCIASMNS
jgi:dTDP-4-dehydrorhamnose reductase